MQSLVIVPTYNEVENIEELVLRVFSQRENFHILIVDDNSPDGTADRVEKLQSLYPDKLFLEKRFQKDGLGQAYIAGFRWALKRTYDYIFEMDADLSHNPDDLSKLLENCVNNRADITIGSRYIKGINVVNWPLGRILLSYGASLYVRIITGMRIRDSTAGFICYKRCVLESINMDAIRFSGYAFQIEMKYKAYCQGFELQEIPIIFRDRKRGQSKMNGAIIFEGIIGVIKMKLRLK